MKRKKPKKDAKRRETTSQSKSKTKRSEKLKVDWVGHTKNEKISNK